MTGSVEFADLLMGKKLLQNSNSMLVAKQIVFSCVSLELQKC